MSEEIIKVFDYIGEKLGIAIDYTQKNIQPYLEDLWHRYITYEIVINSLHFAVSFIITLLCLYFILRFFKAVKKADNGEVDSLFYYKKIVGPYSSGDIALRDLGFVIMFVSCLIGAIFAILTFFQLLNLIELLIIPEKFMLELVKTI